MQNNTSGKPVRKARERSTHVNPSIDFTRKVKMEFCHHYYCMGDGAKYAYKRAQNEVKVAEDGQTSEDGGVTLDKTNCLGHCGHGPNVKVTYIEDDRSVILEKTDAFRVGEIMAPVRARMKRKKV